MKAPNRAPVWCALYPDLAAIARSHGYALAIHGSLARDLDLICVPWIESPSAPREVVDQIVRDFAIKQIGEPSSREHGREVFTLAVGFDDSFIDLSFMPIAGDER